MAGKLEYLTKSLLNQPLLATEETLYMALDFLENRWNFKALDFGAGPTTRPSKDTAEGKIAQINLYGPMMRRAMGLEALCGAMGYDDYRMQFDTAFDNPNVETVVLAVSSGGGDAAGLFDLAQHVYDKKKESGKKLIAYVEDLAASAAYAMAAVADEIVIEKTASVGSIGVITTHADMSKKLEKDGIVVTPIYAGKFKAAGNPYEALSDETKAMIQERVDSLYNIFVAHVAEMRGMSEEAVRATEAKVFLANDAIELGLADKIMSADEFMAYLENDDGDSMDFSLNKQKTQEKAVSNTDIDMAEFEAMKAQLAELTEAKAQLAAFEAEKTQLATELAEAKALMEEKAAAEQAAKLESLKSQATQYSAFGLNAEEFAEKAMKADSDLVAMTFKSLAQAKAQVEASAEFKELGADAEGEGLENPTKESASMRALKAQYKKDEK